MVSAVRHHRLSALSLAGLIAAVIASAAVAHAGPITFASFQTAQGTTPILGLNGSGDLYSISSLGTAGAASVLFYFNQSTIYDAQQSTGGIPATLTITGSTTDTATIYSAGSPFYVSQPITDLTFTFTAVTPVDGETILLQATSSTGTIEGQYGDGATGSTDGSSLSGDIINFSSDVLDVSGPDRQYNFVLNTINPGLSVTDTQINPFTADATGSFDASPVPEPASLGLLAVGSLALLQRRRR